MKKLSIVGKDYHTEEDVVGYYNTGDRMKKWRKLGAFLGILSGSAFFIIPGIGLIVVGSPLLAFVAGIMVYISLDELLPIAHRYSHGHTVIVGVVLGMFIMGLGLLMF